MVRVCALGLSLLLAASTAYAQVSATTGSINGRVTDNTGGTLPGVTVTASSPSMQGTRTDVTNAAGEYRFPAVPPGTYKLVYELGGFGTVNREGVNVGLGFTATVNIELGVANLQETVTVSGNSPVVDVSTTTTASNFGQERLAALPNARDFWTVLMAAPAVVVTRIDVGGSAAGTQTGYAVYDTKEDQHRPMVEGIVNTEGTNAAGFYYDYGSIDEVAVQTKGHTAEMPWPGVWSNFVAKSGGNEFHGKLYGDYQNQSVQRENIPDTSTFLCPSVGGVRNCGSLSPSDLNRMKSVLRPQRRCRRLRARPQGPAVVVHLAAPAEHQDAGAELPGQGLRDRPEEHLGQDHLRLVAEQQAQCLRHVGPEVTAQPDGHLPHRRHHRPARVGSLDLEAGVLGAHLQAWLRIGGQRQDVRGSARRPVQVRLAELPLQRGAGLPGHRQSAGQRRQP